MFAEFKFKIFHFLSAVVIISLIACIDSQPPSPPHAKVIPKKLTMFGDTRTDNYYWLREKDNPDVIAYLQAENAYTEAMMSHTEDLQSTLYDEMLSRIKESDVSAPVKYGDYYYYTRTEEGKQYKIYCRKRGSPDAAEEIILDENQLAAGHDFFKLGVFKVSPDHQLLAYSVDTTGSETYTIHVRDLRINQLLPDKIEGTYYSLAWANDNQTFFYTIVDEAQRPYKLFRHRLNSEQKDDKLVYHETDEKYFVLVDKTKNDRFILLQLASMITTEVRYVDADKPDQPFKVILPRKQGVEYTIENHQDYFYILTNDNAENFQLLRAPVANPVRRNWVTLIPNSATVKLDDFEVFRDYLVVYERENGLKQIRIRRVADGEEHYVDFPDPVYTCYQGSNPEFNTSILRYTYTSLVRPQTDYDYDMEKKSQVLVKQEEVLGEYNPDNYLSERIFAESPDGTMVPVSLVYRKDMKKDGQNPLFLYAYGSYGSSRDPSFRSTRLSLLDRGFIYAIAHIRGGGEMGRYWYEQGKLLNKKNTFYDFIACAEHLIAEKYTAADKLVIQGGSAGGLLMGAVSNMRPDLFEIVLAHVPWVDVVTTMLDESIPLTVNEFEEWGNPKDKEYYEYMKSYSPYDNVEAKAYPNMLITTSLNDTRVMFWEPAKWTARLRANKTDNNILLLKTNMGAGHSGASGRYDDLKDLAFEYAFVLDILGIEK
jgi:oligopeptidase B